MCIYDIQVLSERTIQNFKPTRLAIKRLAGQFYFCKSTKEDFITYVGSGVRWLKRIKKYGRKNVETLWVSDWYFCPHELQEIALHFSKENQIVESDRWANIKPENGLDGGMDDETRVRVNRCPNRRRNQSAKMSSDKNPSKLPDSKKKASERMKEKWEDPVFRETSTTRVKKQWDDPDFQKVNSERAAALWKNEEFVQKITTAVSERHLELWKNDEYKKEMSDKRLAMWANQEYRDKQTGKNHSRYDSTVYSFIHKSGIVETCTRFELIKKYSLGSDGMSKLLANKRKTCSGWKLLIGSE
jgi:hypothetical protein